MRDQEIQIDRDMFIEKSMTLSSYRWLMGFWFGLFIALVSFMIAALIA